MANRPCLKECEELKAQMNKLETKVYNLLEELKNAQSAENDSEIKLKSQKLQAWSKEIEDLKTYTLEEVNKKRRKV